MALARHDNFKEYTKKELNDVKRNVCIANKCPYMKKMVVQARSNDNANGCYCDYISMTGHSRGCLPIDCTHYKDENVKKRVVFADGDYTYINDDLSGC